MWVHGPIVSATSTPRSRSCRYCCSVCGRNRSCQPLSSSTGTCTRSSAARNRSAPRTGPRYPAVFSQVSHHGARSPSSARPAAPSGTSPAARMTFFWARSWRMPARIRPGSSWWATRLLQPRKSLTVNEPVPHADALKSCGTRGDHGRSQFRRRILQHRPLGEAQIGNPDGGEATGEPRLAPQPGDRVSAVGDLVNHRIEDAARSERAPHTLQHHPIAAGCVQLGEYQRERKSAAVGSAGQQGADRLRRRARSGRPPARCRRASGSSRC